MSNITIEPLVNNGDRDQAVLRVAANLPSSATLFPAETAVYAEISRDSLLEPMETLFNQQLQKFGYELEDIHQIWERLPQQVPFRIQR
jgi:hypothetical protein